MKYLNLGSGTGFLSGYDNIDILYGQVNLDLENGLPIYKSDSVDGVVAVHTICLIKNKQNLFKEIYRVLKPGGWFRIVDNGTRFYIDTPPVEPSFNRGYMSRKELLAYLKELKFKNIIETKPKETELENKEVLLAEAHGHSGGFALEMYK